MALTKITRYSKCIVVDTYIADVPSSADLREVGDCPMANLIDVCPDRSWHL